MMAKSKTEEMAVLFLERVISFYPYRIHRILTGNGGEFTYAGMPKQLRPKDEYGNELIHPFTAHCIESGIKHKRSSSLD